MSTHDRAARRRGRPRLDDQTPGQPTTRDRILEAASDLFAERGFASASMSAIAEQADLTTGALYGHFEGKAELLLAVVERALRELPMTQLLEVPDRPVSESDFLPRMASEYADPRLQRVRRLAVEAHTAAGRDKRVAELVSDSNLRVARGVRAVLDQALGPGTSPSSDKDREYAARMLLVVVMGLQHLDTLDATLIGDPDWIRYLEAGVARLLERPPTPDPDS